MKTRLHIRNQTHFAEFADNGPGLMMAKAFRKNHPAFRRRKIRNVIQLYPDSVSLGEIHELS